MTDSFTSAGTVAGTSLIISSTSGTIIAGAVTALSFFPTTASQNIFGAGGNATPTGTGNSGWGFGSLSAITSGVSNIAMGLNAGSVVTTASNTINIGSVGANISAQINLGTPATHTSCIIAGIQGVSPGGTPQMVTINPATSQLGSQSIVAGISTMAAIGASPNANGATISGTTLNLQPASHSFGGILTTGAQAFAGVKTFDSIDMPVTASSTIGTITQTTGQGVIFHTYSTANPNLFIGGGAGNFTTTGGDNVGVGQASLHLATSGSTNAAFGYFAGLSLTTGSSNVLIGRSSGSPITIGNQNTFVGTSSGTNTVTGSHNICIGWSTSCSGPAGSNEIVIGGAGNGYVSCIIGGIASITTPGSPDVVVIDPVTEQLGVMSSVPVISSNIMTLDSGTITTSTVRGVSTAVVPISCTRIGNQVIITIPAFQITAFSIGTPTTVNLTGIGSLAATYRPTFASWFSVVVQTGSALVQGAVYISTGGLVTLQQVNAAVFTSNAGLLNDTHIAYNIV